MAWVFASPEYVAAAASDLASIAQSLGAANSAASFPTGSVVAAGGDDVSAAIAALFSAHAQAYQTLSQQAASFHQQFVELMSSGGSQYATAEAANATPMQPGAAFSTDSSVGTGGSRPAGDGTGAAGAAGKAPAVTPLGTSDGTGAAGAVGRLTANPTGAIGSGALSAQAVRTGGEATFFGEGGAGGSGALSDATGAGDGGSFDGAGGVTAPTPFRLNPLGTPAVSASSNSNGSSGGAAPAVVPTEVAVESAPGIGALGGDGGFLSGFGGNAADSSSLYNPGNEAGSGFHGEPGAAGEPGTPSAAH